MAMIKVRDHGDIMVMPDTGDPFMIYLAGPLDNLEVGTDPTVWRREVQNNYPEQCFVWPNTQTNFKVAEKAALVCRSLIIPCDGMLVNLDGGSPFGTLREIEFAAFQLGKPVAIFASELPRSMFTHDLILNDESPSHAFYALLQEMRARFLQEEE